MNRMTLRMMFVLAFTGMTTVYAEQTDQPSVEFLEFLGEWETQEGQWQDPIELLDVDDSALQQGEAQRVTEEQDHE